MKRNMKKYTKTILIGVVLIALGLGYYYYLSNRETPAQSTERVAAEEEYNALANRNINENYPESPKEVLKLYARITRAYYRTNLSDEQVEKLGAQARLLFDDELYATQTTEEFNKALKEDIAEYKGLKRYIADYTIQESNEVNYTTYDKKKYASIRVVYAIRQGTELVYSDTKFTMRQDNKGRWKILYWELVGSSNSKSKQ